MKLPQGGAYTNKERSLQGASPILANADLTYSCLLYTSYLKIVKAMYINKSDEPIAAFRSDNYTRASLAICTLGIVCLLYTSEN